MKEGGFRSGAGGPDVLAFLTVLGLCTNGEMALKGLPSVLQSRRKRPGELERIHDDPGCELRPEGDGWVVYDGQGQRWENIHVTRRGWDTAVAEAKARSRRFGARRALVSDEELLELAKRWPKYGRPRLYKELRAKYAVTVKRVTDAISARNALRKEVSDEELLELAKRAPKLGRQKFYEMLLAAGYAVTTARVGKAILARRLDAACSELVELLLLLGVTGRHPDVIALRSQIATMKAAIAKSGRRGAGGGRKAAPRKGARPPV